MQAPRLAALLRLIVAQQAFADPIFYEVENLGGDEWRYSYTVGNDTGGPIDWFTIWFDPALYEFSLVDLGGPDLEVDPGDYDGPADWDLFVAAPDPLFPGPIDDQFGFYDAFCFFCAVEPGTETSGFTMIFTWLGGPATAPGPQPFTLFGENLPADPTLFTELRTASVAEPGTLALLALGLLGVAARRRA